MTQIPEKIEPPTMTTTASDIVTICPLNQEAVAINKLIDYLTARQELEDTRYKDITSRLSVISKNQLEMKRGFEYDAAVEDMMSKKGILDLIREDQPKHWRAKLFENYWYVTDAGGVNMATERNDTGDGFCYSTCNYHQTEQEAKAYKAKLLADNAQV